MKIKCSYKYIYRKGNGGRFNFKGFPDNRWCRLTLTCSGGIIVCGEMLYPRADYALLMVKAIHLNGIPEPLKSTIKLYRQTLRHRAAGIAARRRRRDDQWLS